MTARRSVALASVSRVCGTNRGQGGTLELVWRVVHGRPVDGQREHLHQVADDATVPRAAAIPLEVVVLPPATQRKGGKKK